jgi:site-specific recombinase XerD
MDRYLVKQNQMDVNAINWEDALQDFYHYADVDAITVKTYAKGVKNFNCWIKKQTNIDYIDKSVILKYKEYLLSTYADTTASTYFSGVKNFFKFLEEYFNIPNISRNIKSITIERTYRKQSLTKEQILKIKADAENNLKSLQDYRDFVIFNLLLYNGLRTIELNRTNKEDVICENGRFIIKIQGKGKKAKTQKAVLMDSVAIPLLTYLNMRKSDTHEPLFISMATNNYGDRLSTKTISKIVKSMLIKNGYNSEQLTAHSLRHTAITFALLGGATLQETQILGRHADINTTSIYAHNIDRLKNAPERYIEEYINSKDDK